MAKKGEKSKYIIYSILFVLFIIGIFFDSNIANFFHSHQNKYIYSFMSFISSYFFLTIVFIIVFVLCGLKNKKNWVKFGLSFIVAIAITYLFKFILQRQRPLSNEFDSFPSNHTTAISSVLPVFKGKFRIIWLIFAILVAFSRIYLGRHYLTDVIAGGFIGYLIGIWICKLVDKKLR